MDALDKSYSCDICSSDFINLINKYNECQDIKVFNSIKCNCKDDWEKDFYSSNEIPIENRVLFELNKLEDMVK